jgi:hypothetical protein
MKSKYKFVLQLSTVQYIINKAKDISLLAGSQPENADALAACVAVMLATALDQGTRDVLSGRMVNYAYEHDISYSDTPYTAILKDTPRKRMQQMPEVLTDGRFKLKFNCPHVQALHDLINLRNQLLHISDEPQVFDENSDKVNITNDGIKISLSESDIKFLWSNVTLEQVQKYQTAVDIYFREVLFPENGEIRNGQIVTQIA